MKQFISFVTKEAKHILRDKRTMLILFGMPVVMMLIFGFAITNDVKNVRTVVVTSQMDHATQSAIDHLAASEYFTLTATVPTPKNAELMIRSQKADLAIVFSKDHTIQFIVDGSDPNMAQQWTNYALQVVANPNVSLLNYLIPITAVITSTREYPSGRKFCTIRIYTLSYSAQFPLSLKEIKLEINLVLILILSIIVVNLKQVCTRSQ